MKEQEFKLNALELNVLSRIRANGIVTASLEESKRAITAAVRRLTKKGLIVQLPSTDKFGRFDLTTMGRTVAALVSNGKPEAKKFSNEVSTLTKEEWMAKGRALFGDDQMEWQFVCPSCGHVAKVQDWKDAGATSNAVAFSCVGRWLPSSSEAFSGDPGPCNYAGGGLIRINPWMVDGVNIFAFAEPVPAQEEPV